MASIAELEAHLAKCRRVIVEHDKTVMQLASLCDSEQKRALLDKFETSLRIAKKAERETSEALNRERAKFN